MLGNANGHKKSKIMDFETSPLWGMSGERDTFTVHTIYLLFAINSKRKGKPYVSNISSILSKKKCHSTISIEEPLGGRTKISVKVTLKLFREEIEIYITSTNHEF